jgi:hypothetical protein
MTKTATVHAQQKWEYMESTRKSEAYLLQELNQIGQEGWELVNILQAKDRKGEMSWIAFLKRPYVPGAAPPQREAAAAPAQASEEKPEAEPADAGEDFDFDEEDFKFQED